MEVTRANYMAVAYPDGAPDGLDEDDLPEAIRSRNDNSKSDNSTLTVV